MVKDLLDHIEHDLTLLGKHFFKVTELAAPMGQTVTPDHLGFMGLIPRQRIQHN